MHVEFLVEEPSAEAALQNLVPKILGAGISFAIHPHQGKPDLLAKLPGRLRGYRTWLPEDWRIVVLVDADDQECRELKDRLEAIARDTGLVTKSAAVAGSRVHVLNRLAVRELEAWFFGDVAALHAAFPRLDPHLGTQARFRDPDAIPNTWEALERELQRRGYFPGGLPKIQVAHSISACMEPERNQSSSFQIFRQGLLELVKGGQP